MQGDTLEWLIFVLGIVASILINLGTGLLLALAFVTLQLRRDLQAKLDDIWLLAKGAFNDITSSRLAGELRGDGGRASYARLWDVWTLSKRTLHFALTNDQWNKFVNAMRALGQLSDLYTDPKFDRYWRQCEIKAPDGAGGEITTMADFGEWAAHYNLAEELNGYRAFDEKQKAISRAIAYLLFYNPDKFEVTGDLEKSPPLPTELEQLWNFHYLFPRACKWFLSELFGTLVHEYRQSNREWNERNKN
jgi:hypothetical protein